MGAEEALLMGLCNRVCETGEAVHTVLKLARSLAEFPQLCVRADRTSSYEQWDLPLERALLEESRRGLSVIGSGETVQGRNPLPRGKGTSRRLLAEAGRPRLIAG